MFGLMRSCGCGGSVEARRLRQLHYCSTCKATGRLFGQRARLTLNHDAVFLGELLLALEKCTLPPSFTPRRCLALPVAAEIPAALAYAAAANIALAEFALADKLADNEGTRWRLARHGLSKAFLRARTRLRAAGVPLETLFAQHAEQARVEAAPTTLFALATPTAAATELIFSHGNRAFGERLGSLGAAFGRLVYTLDAIVDQARDLKQGAFNALTATQTRVPEALCALEEHQQSILATLRALPLAATDQRRFGQQLNASVQSALMAGQGQQQRPRPRYEPPRPRDCRGSLSRCRHDICDLCACLSCDCTCSCCSTVCASAAVEGCGTVCANCGCGACCCVGC